MLASENYQQAFLSLTSDGFLHSLSGSFVIAALMLITLSILYAIAVRKLIANGRGWNQWRTASFICGVAMILVALSPPLAQHAHHDLRMHMVQHLLIGMFAPLGLVLAAPFTLFLNTVPAVVSRWLVRFLHSEFFVWLAHPFTALLLNIGGMYLLYLTPLYALSLSHHSLHYFIHIHFLLSGYLFTWAIAGPDAAPRRPSFAIRTAALFIGIAAHAILAKLMYIYLFPFDTHHNLEEIRSAAKIMYYGGDFSELLLAVALFAIWYRNRGNSNKSHRHAITSHYRRISTS